MRLKQCVKGHFFDADMYSDCPVCAEDQPPEVLPLLAWCSNGHCYNAALCDACPICKAEEKTSVTEEWNWNEDDRVTESFDDPDNAGGEAAVTERINPFANPELLSRLELEEPWLRVCPQGHQYNSKLYGDCPVCDVSCCKMEEQWSDYYADRTPDRVWYAPLDQEIDWDMPMWSGASLCKVGREYQGLFCEPLSRSLNVIGRGVGNHIMAEGNNVKFKEHAFILCDRKNDTYYFIAGNTDGEKNQFSWVNGERISAGGIVRLQEGDVIRIGISVWCFVKSVHDFKRSLSIVERVSEKFFY